MKIFEMYDEESHIFVGTLIYYEKMEEYIVELQDYLDEWNAPLLFSYFVKKGEFTIPRDISKLWVKERVIPSGRQNINDILNRHKLKEYSEIAFLELSKGRCSQDFIYLKRVENLPEYVIKRAERNVEECAILGENKIMCIFRDGTIKIVELSKLRAYENIEKVLNNKALFETLSVTAGGFAISFNGNIDISARLLYREGEVVPLKKSDLLEFVKQNILDTSDSSKELNCSRQNLAYLVSENKISPIKENVKGNLYLKGDVCKNQW